MDILKNPGPGYDHERTTGSNIVSRNNTISLERTGTANLHDKSSVVEFQQFSSLELKSLRWATKAKLAHSILSTLKDLSILKYRGKRAGKRRRISVIKNKRRSFNPQPFVRCANSSNLITIQREKQTISSTQFVPSVSLANVMSLAPKFDEINHFVLDNNIDISCFTETWLRDTIPSSVIDIRGYNLIRQDRIFAQHGGVCLYIKESMASNILSGLEDPNL